MLGLIVGLAAAAVNADSVAGRWKTETKNGIVEIAPCGPSICGKLVGSDGLKANPNLLDTENKDAALRTRKLMGMPLLGGFSRDGNGWSGGWIYKADDGKTYKSSVKPLDANRLEVKGCVLFICKAQTWVRVG